MNLTISVSLNVLMKCGDCHHVIEECLNEKNVLVLRNSQRLTHSSQDIHETSSDGFKLERYSRRLSEIYPTLIILHLSQQCI